MTNIRLSSAIPLLLVAGAIWILGCKRSLPDERPNLTSQPHPHPYYKAAGHPQRVIVFIHGIFGDSDTTWSYSPTVNWPSLLMTDTDVAMQNTDIYLAGYNTPYFGNSMSIDDVVSNLQNRLEGDRVFEDHREVVIIAHSLGGLIIQRLLLTFRAYAPKVKFIYFYGTPQSGVQIARLGSLLSADPLLEEMIPNYRDNHYLENLEQEWQHSGFAIPRYCAFEKEKTYHTVLVVDEMSGTRGCDHSIAIAKDHISIVKPKDRDDDSYYAFRNEIRKLLPVSVQRSPVTVNPCDNPNVGQRPITCLGGQ